VVKLLLQAGAEVDKANDEIGTPLQEARMQGHEAVVAALIAAGANKTCVAPPSMLALARARHPGDPNDPSC
jgi:ankyrin repeat protein